MSDTVSVAIISGLVSIIGASIAIIPTIVGNRKKTTKEIQDKNDEIVKKISTLETSLNDHIKWDTKNEAMDARRRFLAFYDEEKHRKKHSREHWIDILDDIDAYDSYCLANPTYPNHKGDIAKEYIIKAFKVNDETDNFLK